MILNDAMIKTYNHMNLIKIIPFNEQNIQPNSYELTLGKDIIIMYSGKNTEPKKATLPYKLKHGDFILATTAEKVELNDKTCAMVTGKSTIGRRGISVHKTAGWIDCGFRGNITLEVTNDGQDYELKEGMRIAQLIFYDAATPQRKYGERGNHYQEQEGVTLPFDWEE